VGINNEYLINEVNITIYGQVVVHSDPLGAGCRTIREPGEIEPHSSQFLDDISS
jgi:hypothetical protein